jgi:hypothetical protein
MPLAVSFPRFRGVDGRMSAKYKDFWTFVQILCLMRGIEAAISGELIINKGMQVHQIGEG